VRLTSVLGAAAFILAGCSNSGPDVGTGGSGGAAGSPPATGGSTSGAGPVGGGGTSGATASSGGAPNQPTAGMGTIAGGAAGSAGAGGAPASGGGLAVGGAPPGAGSGQGGASGAAGSGMAGSGGGEFVQPELVTSAEGAYWVTTGALTEVAAGTADVTVNDTTTAQTWEGFGGSFNELGWVYLSLLSESDRNRALSLLFGRDGCNFTLGRIPMGASDYASDRYTLDEVPAGETDLTMEQFSIARDEELLIPYVKAAQGVKGDIHFWASPWSPPTWMKEGPFNDEFPFDGGSIKGDAGTLGAFAQYFVKFVQAYEEKGIEIEVVSPQNEPGYSGTYPTCAWAPETYASFVGTHLAPAIAGAGLDTKIMLGTFNAGDGDTSIISTVMGDATAAAPIGVLGYQWGMLDNVQADQKYDLPIWQTEHKCGNYPWETPFNDMVAPNDLPYAVESWELVRDWIKAGVSAYSVWNMVLDTVGNGIDSMRFWPQNALLTVDTTAKTLTITPAYYVFRHFSQFVEPGAMVLGTTGGDALAFKNPDGTYVTVLYNSGAAKMYSVAVAGKRVEFAMPGAGWATVTQ
jgi:glucosylceramidase